MIDASWFVKECEQQGIAFFTGVPDSLLQSFCAVLADSSHQGFNGIRHLTAVNEGGSIALAAGHYLATGRPALVYMQNSGQGNAINPLLSLADQAVYGIPMILLIGWRGEPGHQDEPQHKTQGELTISLLDTLRIPSKVLPDDPSSAMDTVSEMLKLTHEHQGPVAIIVRKGTFESHSRPSRSPDLSDLQREAAIEAILATLPVKACVVGTTGMISREIFEIRTRNHQGHEQDFLTVGSMGHSSQIALGIHLSEPSRFVVSIDGDGAALMHMGHLATIAQNANGHFLHIVLNNAAHDSVGGQETLAGVIDLTAIAKACGYNAYPSVLTLDGLKKTLGRIDYGSKHPGFLEVCVRKGARPDLGRPTQRPVEAKQGFMSFLRQTT